MLLDTWAGGQRGEVLSEVRGEDVLQALLGLLHPSIARIKTVSQQSASGCSAGSRPMSPGGPAGWGWLFGAF